MKPADLDLNCKTVSKSLVIYSRTSLARTRRDRLCEFDPSMCSSDT